MSPIIENEDQIEAFDNSSNDKPVVMLNLLKFKPEGGIDSYAQYSKKVVPFLEAAGGEMIFLGKAKEVLHGNKDYDNWDAVMLVRYPSRKALAKMGDEPGFREIHQYRKAGLERAVLLAVDEMSVRDLFFKKKSE